MAESTTGAATNPSPAAAESDPPAADPSRLFVWATGSFHAALLVTAGVAGLHLSGAAGDLLQGVGTLPGALAYLYLLAVTLVTTRRALRASGVTPVGGVPDGVRALVAALLWGGATGLGFFAGLFVLVAGVFVLQGGLDAASIVVLLLVAAVVGTLVGLVLGLLDLALLRAAVLVAGDISGGGS